MEYFIFFQSQRSRTARVIRFPVLVRYYIDNIYLDEFFTWKVKKFLLYKYICIEQKKNKNNLFNRS